VTTVLKYIILMLNESFCGLTGASFFSYKHAENWMITVIGKSRFLILKNSMGNAKDMGPKYDHVAELENNLCLFLGHTQ